MGTDEDAEQIALKALAALGWTRQSETGLRVGHGDLAMDETKARELAQRIRASGSGDRTVRIIRECLTGPWKEAPAPATHAVPERPVRRLTKVVSTGPPPAKKPPPKPAPKTTGTAAPADVYNTVLFADPEDQLRYLVRHHYLMTVPVSQREQWPMDEATFSFLPSFMSDLDNLDGAVSRQQVVAAIVDVVSTRVNDVNSRRPRPLREGGGDDGRPQIIRTDGASAWRANVSHGTPAARRIMWWRLPNMNIELARFAAHDDVSIG